jgi:hypothetical protein
MIERIIRTYRDKQNACPILLCKKCKGIGKNKNGNFFCDNCGMSEKDYEREGKIISNNKIGFRRPSVRWIREVNITKCSSCGGDGKRKYTKTDPNGNIIHLTDYSKYNNCQQCEGNGKIWTSLNTEYIEIDFYKFEIIE